MKISFRLGRIRIRKMWKAVVNSPSTFFAWLRKIGSKKQASAQPVDATFVDVTALEALKVAEEAKIKAKQAEERKLRIAKAIAKRERNARNKTAQKEAWAKFVKFLKETKQSWQKFTQSVKKWRSDRAEARKATWAKFFKLMNLEEISEGSLGRYWAWTLFFLFAPPICFSVMGIYYYSNILGVAFVLLAVLWLVGILRQALVQNKQNQMAQISLFGKPVAKTGPGLCIVIPWIFSINKVSSSNFKFDFEESGGFEVTTASAETCNWEKFWEVVGMANSTAETKKEMRERIEKDPNHRATVLNPAISATFTRTLPLLDNYLKNVPGETDEERELWLRAQMHDIVRTMVNANFKLFTYAQLQMVYTKQSIHEEIKAEIDKLIQGGRHANVATNVATSNEDIHLGIDCVNLAVSALGGSKAVHEATNKANAAQFDAITIETLKKAEGKGLKHLGTGQATFIKEVLAEAAKKGATSLVLEYLAKVEFAKGGKAVYFTDSSGNGNAKNIAIANLITEAIEKGGSNV